MKKAIALIVWAGAAAMAFIGSTMAYIFTSTWITVESTDVTNVTSSATNAIATQYEVLKFLGLFLLIGASWFVLTKVLGIRIWGGAGDRG